MVLVKNSFVSTDIDSLPIFDTDLTAVSNRNISINKIEYCALLLKSL